jgi:hypothetical protein
MNCAGDAERKEMGGDGTVERESVKAERSSYQVGEGTKAADGQDDSVSD